MTDRQKSDLHAEEQMLSGSAFLNVVPYVWAARKQIVIFILVAMTLSTILVFLLPKRYMAETSILPELEKNKLLGLAGGADFAALTGVNLGDTPVSRLYPMIINSARVLSEVIYDRYKTDVASDSLNLVQFLAFSGASEAERFEKTLKGLRDRMDVSFDNRLGTLVLRVEMEEPELAANVANAITRELDLYTRTKRRTSATAQREFIEQRLAEVSKTLRRAEDSLKSFRSGNRRIVDSPTLLIEQGRLERDVQINSTVFIELKKQVEIAKIEEIKNIPLINVLDVARVPVRKSYPPRLMILIVVLGLSTLIALLWVVLRTNKRFRDGVLVVFGSIRSAIKRGETEGRQ